MAREWKERGIFFMIICENGKKENFFNSKISTLTIKSWQEKLLSWSHGIYSLYKFDVLL